MRLLMIGFTMEGKSNDSGRVDSTVQMMQRVDEFSRWISNSS